MTSGPEVVNRWEPETVTFWNLPFFMSVALAFLLLSICKFPISFQFSSVQSFSHVQLFVTPWNAAHQASLSITSSWSLPKLMTIESMMPSNHPLSSPSPPPFNLSQHQALFKWVSSAHQAATVLEFQLQHQSFQRIFRTDFLWWTGRTIPFNTDLKWSLGAESTCSPNAH